MVLPASGEPAFAGASEVLDPHLAREVVEDGQVVRLGEERDDVGGERRTDAIDRVELAIGVGFRIGRGGHRLAPSRQRAVVAGQQLRRRLAHLANTESVDEAVERNHPSRLDGAPAGWRPTSGPSPRARGSPAPCSFSRKISAGSMQQAVLAEGDDVALAQAVDVEGIARDEMLEALDRLRRADQAAGAAARRLARLAHGEAAALRAVLRKDERLTVGRAAPRAPRRPPAG